MAVSDLLILWVLPFVLIFVLVFAILHKTKLFGDDKQQINALLAAVLAALFVMVPGPHTHYVVNMIPWLAVALVVLLIFFLIYGFVVGELKDIPSWMQWAGLVFALVVVGGVIAMVTDIESLLTGYLDTNGDWMFSILVLIVAVLAVYWAVRPQGSSSS